MAAFRSTARKGDAALKAPANRPCVQWRGGGNNGNPGKGNGRSNGHSGNQGHGNQAPANEVVGKGAGGRPVTSDTDAGHK
jgi:hypothetical protein